jgi:hypothetical protein
LKKTDLKDTKLNNQCQKFAKFEEKKVLISCGKNFLAGRKRNMPDSKNKWPVPNGNHIGINL